MKFPNLGFSSKNYGQSQAQESDHKHEKINLSDFRLGTPGAAEIPLRAPLTKLPRIWLDDEGTYHVDIPCGSRCVVNIASK